MLMCGSDGLFGVVALESFDDLIREVDELCGRLIWEVTEMNSI